MKLRFFTLAASVAAAALLTPAGSAEACGACFVSQQQSTVVTGHRMVLSVSPTQSVLWDQIKYSGDPTEFAWVLPVKAGAVIETANDAWFETLDAATTATVLSPQVSCAQANSGFGCGAAQSAGLEDVGGTGGGGDGVTVLHEGTVGPYETVTLKATQPGALNQWLSSHNFNVDASTQPIIDAYVQEGFDFIALRLQPGQGVRQMKPVRVVTPGAASTLPLRMVAAGTGADVSIILFTISEARYAVDNFGEVKVPQELIVWDFEHQTSTYPTVRAQALSVNGGASFLTVFAQPRALLSPVVSQTRGFSTPFVASDGFSPLDTIAAAYVDRGFANGEASSTTCASELSKIAQSMQQVVNPCPIGKPPNDPACTAVQPDEIDSRTLSCGALDDLAVALRGLHPHDVWLTRLEANLPRAALSKDLDMKPAAQQTPVDNFIQAKGAVGDPCPSTSPPRFGGRGPKSGALWGLVLLAMGAVALGRRAARQRLA